MFHNIEEKKFLVIIIILDSIIGKTLREKDNKMHGYGRYEWNSNFYKLDGRYYEG